MLAAGLSAPQKRPLLIHEYEVYGPESVPQPQVRVELQGYSRAVEGRLSQRPGISPAIRLQSGCQLCLVINTGGDPEMFRLTELSDPLPDGANVLMCVSGCCVTGLVVAAA